MAKLRKFWRIAWDVFNSEWCGIAIAILAFLGIVVLFGLHGRPQ